ncbi:MAG TPA: FHA domain-containing protein [Candidatus Polarisedimenticolaceae bacterium]|nr:FHA domain-containing protein [Candidatus Polarisedimenticolaceae bacterium]
MRDGRTQRHRAASRPAGGVSEYLKRFAVKVVLVSGREAGVGFALDRERTIVGRGPGVDRAFDDPAMSRQHAAIEFFGSGFRLRDLGSTNGVTVNGHVVQTAELHHGDHFEIGGQRFLLAVEARESEPETYELSS